MRDGCAGFFTPEELAAGKGIVPGGLLGPDEAGLARTAIGRADPDASPVVSTSNRSTPSDGAISRRRSAPRSIGSTLDDPLPLPGGRMTLVHRVAALDPTGGPAGLGLIRAEADIHPGDWFMVCHFVDDRVMPGTLMYECCLHALRIFLMRLGWVGREGQVAFEPVPGIANRLKCRGQIIESTRVVTYEVTIKERGYRPEPYAIADALIFADGKPIVEVTDMALQLSGTNRGELERLWSGIATGDSRSSMPSRRRRRVAVGAGPVHARSDPRLRGRQAVGRVRRPLPAVRRRAIHCPAPRASLSVPRSDHAQSTRNPG